MGILAAKHIILTWKFTLDVEVFLQGNNCLHTIALALNATKCCDLQLRRDKQKRHGIMNNGKPSNLG